MIDDINRWAFKNCERWYLEPEEPTDWEAEEEAFWNECDRRYEEERGERLGGVSSQPYAGNAPERGSRGSRTRF